MDRVVTELQEKLRRIICEDNLWEKLEQVARDQYRVRSLMGASRYTVIRTTDREELFRRIYAEEKECHTKGVDCGKEPVIAGR